MYTPKKPNYKFILTSVHFFWKYENELHLERFLAEFTRTKKFQVSSYKWEFPR